MHSSLLSQSLESTQSSYVRSRSELVHPAAPAAKSAAASPTTVQANPYVAFMIEPSECPRDRPVFRRDPPPIDSSGETERTVGLHAADGRTHASEEDRALRALGAAFVAD